MIIRNNKVISALYKGTKEILRRYKGIQLIYEAVKKLFASGSLPLVLRNCRGNNYILPEKYVELSCIEADSNAYIDTGFYPDSNTSIEIEALIKSGDPTVSKNNFIFGTAESADNNNRFAYNLFYSAYSYTFGAYPRFSINTPTMLKELEMDKWYTYKVKNGKFYVNNEIIAEYTETFEKTSFALYLNAHNKYGTVELDHSGNSKIGKCKIWDGDILARNFIPCYCKDDNSVGLYDLVENKFYTSATAYGFKKGLTKDALPIEYQQIEYIESNGTQYIDTKYIPKTNDVYKIKFSQTSIDGNHIIFGSRMSGAYTDSLNQVYLNKSHAMVTSNRLLFFSGTTMQDLLLTEVDKIYELELNINNGNFDNSSDKSLYLFGFNNMGNPTACSSTKIYSFKILNNKAIIRNFIPCLRKEDDVVGMYDLIENKFYTSETESNFIKGPGYYKLPEEYQQLEYIESTGTQYIDTGFIPTRTTKIEDTVSHMTTTSTATLFGAGGAENNRFQCYHGNPNDPRIAARLFSQGTIVNITVDDLTKKHVVIMDAKNKIFEVQGVEQKTLIDGQGVLFNYSIALFGNNMMGTIATQSAHRRYSFRIWDAGVLKRDMLPCYRKSDGVIGMYDLVFGVFYQNSGTGEFLKGANKITPIENSSVINYRIYGNSVGSGVLPAEYQHVEYIESTGTQYIDTKVPLREGLKMVVDWVYNDADSGNSYTGAHIGSPGNRWLVGSQRTNGRYYFAVGGVNLATEFKFGNRDIVEAYWKSSESYIKVNGTESTLNDWRVYFYSDVNTAIDYTFYLGATNRTGNATLKPKLKIYGCKFYQDDILIRNFIPCYNRINNQIGLYDLVENKFYANAGTGEFLKGNDFISSGSGVELQGVGDKTTNILNPDFSKTNAGTYSYILLSDTPKVLTLRLIDRDPSVDISKVSFGFTGNGANANDDFHWCVAGGGVRDRFIINNTNNGDNPIENPLMYFSVYPKSQATWEAVFKRFYIQIVEGEYTETTMPDYEPFGYRIPIVTMNNNFLNIAACEEGTIHGTTGADHWQTNRIRTGYIYLNRGKYCISTKNNELNVRVGSNAHVYSQPDDAFWVAKIALGNEISTEDRKYRVIDAPIDGYYRFIFLPVGFDDSSKILGITNFYQFEPQIELGAESIGFIAWREPKIVNNYISQPLFYLSQDFCDYIDFQKQKLIQSVGIYTFNGTEEIELYKEIEGGSVFRIDNFVSPKIGAPMTATAMTHFSVTSIYSTADFYPGLYRFVSSNPVQNIGNTGLYISSTHTTVEEFKEWLSINKPKLYYPLDEPVEIDVNLLNIDLQHGDNIIDAKCTAKPDKVEVEYKGKE